MREMDSDTSFIRNYLTKELVMREDMYLFQRQGKEYKVVDKVGTCKRSTRKYENKRWLSISDG